MPLYFSRLTGPFIARTIARNCTRQQHFTNRALSVASGKERLEQQLSTRSPRSNNTFTSLMPVSIRKRSNNICKTVCDAHSGIPSHAASCRVFPVSFLALTLYERSLISLPWRGGSSTIPPLRHLRRCCHHLQCGRLQTHAHATPHRPP